MVNESLLYILNSGYRCCSFSAGAVEGSFCIKVSKGNIIIKAHYKGESPLKEPSIAIATPGWVETWSSLASFELLKIRHAILSFDSSVRMFSSSRNAGGMCWEWTSILISLLRFGWLCWNRGIACGLCLGSWIVYGVSMFDWTVCAIFWFRVRGYLFPWCFSGRELLWRSGLRVRKERRDDGDYLRNAWLEPWRAVLIAIVLPYPELLRSSGGVGSILQWTFNRWRWFHIVLGWRRRGGSFWRDVWRVVWAAYAVIWRLTGWVRKRLIR